MSNATPETDRGGASPWQENVQDQSTPAATAADTGAGSGPHLGTGPGPRPWTNSTSVTGAGRGPLYRPTQDRMLAGVASGAARFLGIDVMLVRIAFVVLCFVGGLGIPLYLASWLLIPEEGAEQSIAADLIQSIQGRRV